MTQKAGITITPDIARSLSDAGIGKRFHHRSFSDFGAAGETYREWVIGPGRRLFDTGGLAVFVGVGISDHLRMVARSFHLNGAGTRIVTLPQMVTALRDPDRREDMDVPVLMVSPAQAGNRGCPLSWWQLDVAEAHIRSRVDDGKCVILHWATSAEFRSTDPLHRWWSDDFTAWVQQAGSLVFVSPERGIL